jgi:hypothetical protein
MKSSEDSGLIGVAMQDSDSPSKALSPNSAFAALSDVNRGTAEHESLCAKIGEEPPFKCQIERVNFEQLLKKLSSFNRFGIEYDRT